MAAVIRKATDTGTTTPQRCGPHGRPLAAQHPVHTAHRAGRGAAMQIEGLGRWALGSLPDATLIVDADDTIVFANPLAGHLFGLPPDEIAGLPVRSLLEIEHAQAGRALLCSELSAGSPNVALAPCAGTVHRLDGIHLHVTVLCSPLFDGLQMRGTVLTLRKAPGVPESPAPARGTGSPAPAAVARATPPVSGIVGESAAMLEVLRRIACAAPTPATVLVSGETGTGKELVARAIHAGSPRARKPFVKVNCAAVPRELFESEFFGHARGAFTGAVGERMGRFELADGGTLFLDEVGELPLELQGKLLTVLQDGRLERVGESRSRQVDVRVVAATNRDLIHEVRTGRFRSDLYYRLNVFGIPLPPLRERRDDIPSLAQHIGRALAQRLGVAVPTFTPAVMMRLTEYDWPGNVRELENAIERAMIEAPADGGLEIELPDRVPVPARDAEAGDLVVTESQRKQRDLLSMLTALQRARGKVGGANGAAALLGLNPTTFRSRMKALGIEITSVVRTGERDICR
jgi:PAS domain S-box-containing protein